MAIDSKYGRVTFEKPNTIGEEEPIVIFRARDVLVPKVLMYYHLFCQKAGSPRHHLDMILDAREKIEQWQWGHPDMIRMPESSGADDHDGTELDLVRHGLLQSGLNREQTDHAINAMQNQGILFRKRS